MLFLLKEHCERMNYIAGIIDRNALDFIVFHYSRLYLSRKDSTYCLVIALERTAKF